jgi:hypothetical protein
MTQPTKLRITFTVTMEYEAKPEYYPEGKRTPEAMLEIDLANANEDPFSFLDDYPVEIKGEIVEPQSEDSDIAHTTSLGS